MLIEKMKKYERRNLAWQISEKLQATFSRTKKNRLRNFRTRLRAKGATNFARKLIRRLPVAQN